MRTLADMGPGLIIAALTASGLLVAGVGVVPVAIAVLLWAGSLWLVADTPPPPVDAAPGPGLARNLMGELVEQASTPVMLIERGRVVIANAAARSLLGAHVVGQDARVALRQPAGVELLDRDEDGGAVVQGLTSLRDIWRLNRKTLSDGLTAIEFVNKTAEADIGRAHTDFVANASHELRTPLAAIIGYVETLRDGGAEMAADTRDRFLATIEREAGRLQHLVSDLMSLSRIEAEKHDAPRTVIALAPLVERAARDAAGGTPGRLSFALDDADVPGDSQQLEQVVRNLVDNALKYGAPGEKVEIALSPGSGRRVVLTVRDRGEGIAAEHLPYLTRRFYRTDPSRSRAFGGTGLGLAIVKHIVERHRGRLDIASKPGAGTEVRVTLPAAINAAVDDARPSVASDAERG